MKSFLKFINEEKDKYKGTYNWNKQVLIKYTTASSPAQAHNFMCRQLADQLKVNVGSIINYFKNNQNSYKVDKV